MTTTFYLAQRRHSEAGGEWRPILEYPGSKYVGLSPSLDEMKSMIESWKDYPNMFMANMEYRILRFELPCEVMQ